MEEDEEIAQQLLRTTIDFIENVDVCALNDDEIKNYINICNQVEFYDKKFKQKGFSLVIDEGQWSLSRYPPNAPYDLSLLADRVLEKFLKPSVRLNMLEKAVSAYIDTFGATRFIGFCEYVTAAKRVFSLETVIEQACKSGKDIEGAVFVEVFEVIASASPGGMQRVEDLLQEFIVEDECADSVNSIFGVGDPPTKFHVTIKQILLNKLRAKFVREPHVRLWIKLVCSSSLVDAIVTYEPYLDLVLDILRHVSRNISYDPALSVFVAPSGSLSYNNLVHIIHKIFRLKKIQQSIINFIFNQCGVNKHVWTSILSSCHNLPEEEPEEPNFLESLYAACDIVTRAPTPPSILPRLQYPHS